MPEQGLAPRRPRLEYIGPIGAEPVAAGPVMALLDSVDIWLAGTLQTLFDRLKR